MLTLYDILNFPIGPCCQTVTDDSDLSIIDREVYELFNIKSLLSWVFSYSELFNNIKF